MRKMLLRSFSGLIATCMFTLSGIGFIGGAVGDKADVEIVVYGVDDIQKNQQIANALNGESSGFMGISPASIFCIFGHSMAQATASETTHRHWETAPRCRETTYRVLYCTRASCNHIASVTQIGVRAIPCCK